jgi:hypothetical protein
MKKNLTLFIISDAKLRRFSADSKKFLCFFSKLCGQTPGFLDKSTKMPKLLSIQMIIPPNCYSCVHIIHLRRVHSEEGGTFLLFY